jgi:hypothetical protein
MAKKKKAKKPKRTKREDANQIAARVVREATREK